jgi:toxin ParE1/3/4
VRYRLSPEAVNDIDQAARLYVQSNRSAAVQFIDAVFVAIELLLANPLIGRRAENACRQFELKKFPFSLIYKVDSKRSEVVVYAVIHQSRRPGAWHDRIQEEPACYLLAA